ncbi:DNA adenine methylase [Frateuria aurantia]
MSIPHPIPYQGSKRRLAPLIQPHLPATIDRLYEPFAGSAAMSLYMARRQLARYFVIADCLPAMVELWQAIVTHPDQVASAYARRWQGQTEGDSQYYNRVRDRYNTHQDPADLLYLICRCVKNSIRFNASGHFTQSVDHRRLGTRPDTMARSLHGASQLLLHRSEFRCGDWRETTADATPHDFVYMDPPYLGTTIGRNKRYRQQLPQEELIAGLQIFNGRHLRYALSYDGMTGERSFGPPLPPELNLRRLLLDAGLSSQATLHGRRETTYESLYLSPSSVPPPQPLMSAQSRVSLQTP